MSGGTRRCGRRPKVPTLSEGICFLFAHRAIKLQEQALYFLMLTHS